MRLLNLFLAGIAAALISSAAATAGPPNALDAYVARPDPSYGYRVVGTCRGEGYRCAILQMTSQTWGPKDVDDRVWKHWMTVVIPDNLSHSKAFLYITGGNKGDAAPTHGYRIWPSMDLANSSDHPDRLRLRRMEMSVLARCRTLRASFLRVARFSGAWSFRFRARSSSNVVSSTQWRLFSIRQWARTARAKAGALRVAEER